MSTEKMRARRYTVAALFYPLRNTTLYNVGQQLKRGAVPYIRLRGAWLEKWGFAIGDQIEISAITPGVVVLRKIRTAEAKAPAAVLKFPNDTERHEITV